MNDPHGQFWICLNFKHCGSTRWLLTQQFIRDIKCPHDWITRLTIVWYTPAYAMTKGSALTHQLHLHDVEDWNETSSRVNHGPTLASSEAPSFYQVHMMVGTWHYGSKFFGRWPPTKCCSFKTLLATLEFGLSRKLELCEFNLVTFWWYPAALLRGASQGNMLMGNSILVRRRMPGISLSVTL